MLSRKGFLLLFFAFSCAKQASKETLKNTSLLDPQLPENQMRLLNRADVQIDPYAQLIVTVESDDVLDNLFDIPQLYLAVDSHFLIGTNQSFQHRLYVFKLHPRLNPTNYINFLKEYPGVVAVELDRLSGIAESTVD